MICDAHASPAPYFDVEVYQSGTGPIDLPNGRRRVSEKKNNRSPNMRAAKVTTVPVFTVESIVSRHFKRIVGLHRSKLAHQGKISGMYCTYSTPSTCGRQAAAAGAIV